VTCGLPGGWNGEVEATDLASGAVHRGFLERLLDRLRKLSLAIVWRVCGYVRLGGGSRAVVLVSQVRNTR